MYYCEIVSPSEINIAHQIILDILGPDVVSLSQLKELINKNSETLYLVKRARIYLRSKRVDVVGFFSVLPLTEEAEELMKHHVLTGSRILPEHITSTYDNVRSVYIGGVGGLGLRGKSNTLQQLIGFLKGKVSHTGCSQIIITPISKDGLRLAQAYDFAPIRTPGINHQIKNYIRKFE